MVKTPSFHCREHRFDHWETKILHAQRHGQKRKIKIDVKQCIITKDAGGTWSHQSENSLYSYTNNDSLRSIGRVEFGDF